MPIRPEFRKFYRTDSWRAARAACLDRAGHQCEHCGVRNGAYGWRDPVSHRFSYASGPRWKIRAASRRLVLIQLGAAHLNHTPGDDRPENLAALCRRCHLIYDAAWHKQIRSERKDRARPILVAAQERDNAVW